MLNIDKFARDMTFKRHFSSIVKYFAAQPSLLLMIEKKEISKFDFDRLSYTVYASKLNFDNKGCRKCEENDKIFTESFSVSDSQLRSCQWTRY